MTLPDRLLRDHPFIPGRNNLEDISQINEALIAGQWANRMVEAKAEFMPAPIAAMYNRWAIAHPTVNPRTWAPLAQMGIDPWSDEGQMVAQGDITGAVANGTYDKFVGQKNQKDPPPAVQPVAATPTAPEDDGGFWSGVLGAAKDVGTVVTAPARMVASSFEPSIRTGLAGLESGIAGIEAIGRESAGNNAEIEGLKEKIAKRSGLPLSDLDEVEDFFQGGGEIGSMQLVPGQYSDPLAESQGLDNESREAVRGRFYQQFGDRDNVDTMWDAYRGFMTGRAKVIGAPNDFVENVFNQTPVGIITRSFKDGVKGNYLTSRPETGAVFDPKSKKWVIEGEEGVEDAKWVDHGGMFLPTELYTETTDEAIKSYDMRTAEEIKNGVAPLAWTLGRGIAHQRYSADDQAFYTMSGVIDFNKSLFLDPANIIPVGAAAKAIKVSTATGRAFRQGQEEVLIATRGQQLAGNKILPPATDQARTGSRLAAPTSDKELLLDPVFASRGYLIEGRRVLKPEGTVNVPHAKFVAKREAWNSLTTGKLAPAVEELANETSGMKIWLRSNRQMDAKLAYTLADARSPEEVRAILASRIGVDITDAKTLGKIGGQAPMLSKVPGVGPALGRGLAVAGAELESGHKGAWRKNFEKGGVVAAVRGVGRSPFRLAPSSGVGIDADDLDSIVDEISRFGRGIRLGDEHIIKAVDDLVKAPNGIARYNAIYADDGVLYQVSKALTDEMGIDAGYAKKVTRAFASGVDEQQRLWVNKDLGSASFGARTPDGQVGKPVLLNEMLSSKIYLPDYRTLRRTTGYLKKIDNLAGIGAAEKTAMVSDFMTGVTSVWRDWVLMRPAYMMREVGELSFSMSLAGGKGAFTHPYGFIGMAVQSAAAWHMHTLMGRTFGKAAASPKKISEAAIDQGQRLLITRKAEREMFEMSANLPDAKRPTALKGKTPDQARAIWDSMDEAARSDALWETVDKKALQEYMMLHEGLSWLMPHVNSKWARVNGKTMFEELGRAMDGDEVSFAKFQHELNFASGNMVIDEPAMRGAARHVRDLMRTDPDMRTEYVHALIDSKLTRLAEDRMMRALAKGDKDPSTIAAEWHGTTDWAMRREMRPDLWKTHPDKHMADVSLGEDIEYMTGYGNMLQRVTGGDTTLMKAIADNEFDGKPITSGNQALTKYLSERLDDEDWAAGLPDVLHDVPGGFGAKGNYQRFVNEFFKNTGELSDIFGRSPMVRHFYTEWVTDHAPYLAPAARAQAVANLRRAGDTKLAKQVLKAEVGKKRPNVGTLGVDEMEAAASGYARRKTAKVFYNAHRRQNWAVAYRIIGPFAQATMNTFKRWGSMSLQNPQLAYRTLKPINALRQPGSAVLYEILGDITGDEAMQGVYSPGHPEASVDGFFFHNQYGQRVFAFPGVRKVYNILAGDWNPVMGEDIPEGALPLAQAANLNVAGGTLNPGMGPLVTFPASMVAGNSIYEDNFTGKLQRALFPYGMPQGDWWQKLMGSFGPTFLRKAVIPEETQANHTAMLMPTLAATGEYDLTKQSEIRRLTKDAREMAFRMDTYSAFFGMGLPTTFNWQYAIETVPAEEQGKIPHFMMMDRLAKEWRGYTAAKSDATWQEDYNEGAIRFIEDFGLYAFYSVMPRTEQPGVPFAMAPTADIWSFRTDEPETYEEHRGVIGLFFPGGDPANEWGDPEQNLYSWQRAASERVYKDPEQAWADANTSLGWIFKAVATKEVMATVSDPEQQSAILAQRNDEIAEQFPGWTPDPTEPGRFRKIIDQMEEAVADEVMQTLPGTEHIGIYLAARQDAIESLRDKGFAGTLNADYASPERARLAQLATKLVNEDTSGTFVFAWTRVLGGELEAAE